MTKNMAHLSAIRKNPETVPFDSIHFINLDTNLSYTRYFSKTHPQETITQKWVQPENDYSHKKTIIKSKQAQKHKSEPVFR